MFFKLSTLAILLPFVHALTIDMPTNLTSGGPAHITWTSSAGDPSVWTLELVNPTNFHNTFAISNNVNPSTGFIDLTLPAVPPGDGYILEAVNITNINQVFAQTGDFSIAPTASSTSSSMSSTSSGSSASSGSGSSTVSVTSGASTSSTPFGVTVTSTGSSSAASSGAGTSSSSGSGPSPSSFNGNGNGAASMGFGSVFAMVAAAIAGGVVAA